MNQVAKVERLELPPLAPQSESAAIIGMIERMASDPTVDIARLERILELRERVNAQNEKRAFDAAFAMMQPDLPVISEKGEIKVGNDIRGRYAKWADIGDAIAPVLARHGFALRHRITQADAKVTVTGVLSHREGHSEETSITLPIDTSGSKNAVRAIGSSVSYGQRYTARVLLNLRSRFDKDDDDDGRAAGRHEPITEKQADDLRELIESVGANSGIFLKYYGIASVDDLPAAKLANATAKLEAKRAKQ
jgi:hypothetical protein